MQIARDEAERHRLIRGALDLTRAEHPGGIPIEQQAQQHFGGVWFSTACPIPGIQGRQVKLGHAVYHEARQMVRGQTVAQPHRQIECLVVVHRFEGSTHVHQYTITDGGLLFSDKLLGHSIFFCEHAVHGDDHGQPLSLETLLYFFESMSKPVNEGGTGIYVTPHKLRHTWAAMAEEDGLPPKTIQHHLGHAHLATTEIYSHLSPERIREDLKRWRQGHPERYGEMKQ